ncbi:MAG: imidazole glycerol phosphate synthase subunit HisH [Deltaproteobacteria bacterium]|jgi:glutamine amidotransferase|nr:imidazole glycerol phosphate synthase subunit HisH [Deltaproteobacteria bacterium]
MIAIIDYGAGNLASVARALEYLGRRCEITDRPGKISAAARLVLPGVGAAGATMRNLKARGLVEVLRREVLERGKPLLGICIGIQVLLERSEEDDAQCLGFVEGRALRFGATGALGRRLKVPQFGWNRVRQERSHPLFEGVPDQAYFYYANSYYPEPARAEVVIATSEYGRRFCAVLARDNLVATQFHLEKSGPLGLRMLDNFCRL